MDAPRYQSGSDVTQKRAEAAPLPALLGRLLKKAVWMLIVLWGITIISFIVIHLAPGSPTDMQTSLNPLAGELVRARLDALYGLDRPLLTRISTG